MATIAAFRFLQSSLWRCLVARFSETFRQHNGTVQERCRTLRIGDAGTIRADPAVLAGTGMGAGPALRQCWRSDLTVTNWS